jgi:ABC-2 type transport system ATP-binding protein
MLEARQLTKRYHGVTAVHNVSFVVRPGEVVGYLGANGSGKSTTARLLTRLVAPTAGSVWFGGCDTAADPDAYRRCLGYVPEEPDLYPFLSAREFLLLVGRLRDLPERVLERRLGALLELLGLDRVAEHPIASCSKGTRQKVLIAAALLHDPAIVIFDEPESGLDVNASLLLRHLVRALAARGKAILYSSHVLEIVEKVCDRAIVLDRGCIVADGPLDGSAVAGTASLGSVFATLRARDPEQAAADIVDAISPA